VYALLDQVADLKAKGLLIDVFICGEWGDQRRQYAEEILWSEFHVYHFVPLSY
jgi:hypothetical protein